VLKITHIFSPTPPTKEVLQETHTARPVASTDTFKLYTQRSGLERKRNTPSNGRGVVLPCSPAR